MYTQNVGTNALLTAEHLAKLPIASVARADHGQVGIVYLIAVKRHGIAIALSSAYEA